MPIGITVTVSGISSESMLVHPPKAKYLIL